MTRISLELVPRDAASLTEELQAVRDHFPNIETVNVPDLLRYELRSWDACGAVRALVPNTIPHIRAIDVDPSKPLQMADALIQNRIGEVVVVAGDAPQDMSRRVWHTTSVEVIRMFREQLPEIKVYAAIDPYRTAMSREFRYAEQKLRAGAHGFFTQPFFDIRLLSLYHDMLDGMNVFWGFAPVLGEKSRSYWETKNSVVFPKNFVPGYDWNIRFTRDALEMLCAEGGHAYLMPIRADIQRYLGGVMDSLTGDLNVCVNGDPT